MKNLFMIVLLSILTLVGSTPMFGQTQTYNKSKNNYFVLVQNIGQLGAIIASAKDQAEEDGKKYGEFHVVICGKTVQNLLVEEKINPILKKASEQNVKLFACGVSLDKFQITPSEIPKGIGVVKNGISYSFKLQKEGFYFITL